MSQHNEVFFPWRTPYPTEEIPAVIDAFLSHASPQQYEVYERHGLWYMGLGSIATLCIDAAGDDAIVTTPKTTQRQRVDAPLADYARQFLHTYQPEHGRVYGQIGFHYAAHARNLPFNAGHWPLMRLTVPEHELIFSAQGVTVCGGDSQDCHTLMALTQTAHASIQPSSQSFPFATSKQQKTYELQVQRAITDIQAGLYSKIILSRALTMESPLNFPQTLRVGRPSNQPVRSFLSRYQDQQAVGFCPELVMRVDHRQVLTEPLAGTRALVGTAEDKQHSQTALKHDQKEVFEHIQSVQAAIEELSHVCVPESVVVNDLMSVRERGNVQHFGSTVSGQLNENADAWDALHVLFPGITATGVPKDDVLEKILHYEPTPRELYSGAVLWLEGQETFEAALVLRAAFQDKYRQWLQAGAGIMTASIPNREWQETCEKLACIAPYLVPESETTRDASVAESIWP